MFYQLLRPKHLETSLTRLFFTFIALLAFYFLPSNLLNLPSFCKLWAFSYIKTFPTPIGKVIYFSTSVILIWGVSKSSNHVEFIVMQGWGRSTI